MGQSWDPPPPTRPGTLPSPSRSGHPLWPRGAGSPGRWHRRRRQLPTVISLCRLGFRQPLITRLLMRPAAVCNYPGSRRAAREVTGESAHRGVAGGGGRGISLAAKGVCPARRGRGAHRQSPRFSPSGATEPLLSPLYRGVRGLRLRETHADTNKTHARMRLIVISDREPLLLTYTGTVWISGVGTRCCYFWDSQKKVPAQMNWGVWEGAWETSFKRFPFSASEGSHAQFVLLDQTQK